MPHEIEATATSCAAPEVIFKHLCVAEAWREWGGFWVRGRRESAGEDHPNGIGAVRCVPPWREEVVAWDPPRHYGYIALAGARRAERGARAEGVRVRDRAAGRPPVGPDRQGRSRRVSFVPWLAATATQVTSRSPCRHESLVG
ncbi:SRPBCC family protein [Actinomadura sp. 3N407]|uniref:SRPBCC family protein n=1 Tax=Actinomadura sp. 3N407 TaxID=3457423 RepID=UPI003FCC2F21